MILYSTSSEEADVVATMAARKPSTSRSVGFVVKTNDLATLSLPNAYPTLPTVVVAADWTKVKQPSTWAQWARFLTMDLDGRVAIRAVGPSANRLPADFAGEIGASRLDLWRSTSHAVALVDPMSYGAVGIAAIEAMSYGVPILAHATNGASQYHAQVGDAGLWFRNYGEFEELVELLLTDPPSVALSGSRARTYADETFGDSERYVADVLNAAESMA